MRTSDICWHTLSQSVCAQKAGIQLKRSSLRKRGVGVTPMMEWADPNIRYSWAGNLNALIDSRLRFVGKGYARRALHTSRHLHNLASRIDNRTQR